MKFKGEGVVSTCMGVYVTEFVNGELETDDDNVIGILLTRGYVPVSEDDEE
jgi:hypothetical protein